MLNAALILVLLVATATGFIFRLRRRLRVLAVCEGKPSRRRPLWRRLDDLLGYGFGQRGLFKDLVPGIVHALLFWSLIVLLLRSVSHIGAAFTDNLNWGVFLFSPALHHAYLFTKDVLGLLVIVLVLVVAYRRRVIRPSRLANTKRPTLLLALLALLSLSDFAMSGAKFFVLLDPSVVLETMWTPMGHLFAQLFLALELGQGTLRVIFFASYWSHILLLCGFLLALPKGTGLHILSATQNILCNEQHPRFALAPLAAPVVATEEPPPGLGDIRDLSRKQGLDLLTCTECGRCTEACPATLVGAPLSPGRFIQALREHLEAEAPRLLQYASDAGGDPAAGGAPALPSLVDVVGPHALRSCTTCRACEERCPALIAFLDKVIGMRRNLVLARQAPPEGSETVFENLERHGNPWGRPPEDRTAWCEGLEVPVLATLTDEQRAELDLLFFVGCAGAFEPAGQRTARALVSVLGAAGIRFAILGAEEGCTGDTARRLGDERLFLRQATANIDLFRRYGVKKILTMCPHCYHTLRNEYPDLGADFEVVHHAELIDDLLADDRLPLRSRERRRVAYHDPCYLGRYNETYEAPRAVLEAAGKIRVVEARANRDASLCCGAGGGLRWTDRTTADAIARRRTEELLAGKPDCIATACPFCARSFAESGAAGDTPVIDIAEAVAEALP